MTARIRDVSITRHAVNRLRERVPQFAPLSDSECGRALKLACYLGERVKRSSRWDHGPRRFIKADALFDEGQCWYVVVQPSIKHPNQLAVVSVYTEAMYYEHRRERRQRSKRLRRQRDKSEG